MKNDHQMGLNGSCDDTTPITAEQVILLKQQLLREFMENDSALNEILKRVLEEQNEARVKEERNRNLDLMFGPRN